MPELWNDLLNCLDLRACPSDEDRDDIALFDGTNQQLEYHRLFGGQLLAQLVRASQLSCPGKSIKSLHAVFAREGRADEPVRYEITRRHEGRSFATLSAVAQQSRGVLATATVSMHAHEDGPELQTIEAVPPVLPADAHTEFSLIPWETRTTTDLSHSGVSAPEFEMWMRTPEVDPDFAPALTAYATDLNLIGTALLGVDGFDHTGNGTKFTSAVTSHNLWFHRPFRSDEWLLLRQHSPILVHGRCFGRGDVLTENGSLVASFAQEALVRIPQ